MRQYQKTSDASTILRVDDGVFIPVISGNADYELFLADGGVAEDGYADPMAAITSKYEAKREKLRNDMLHAITMDGSNMESLMAAVRGKWVQLADDEAAEIDATFS